MDTLDSVVHIILVAGPLVITLLGAAWKLYEAFR